MLIHKNCRFMLQWESTNSPKDKHTGTHGHTHPQKHTHTQNYVKKIMQCCLQVTLSRFAQISTNGTLKPNPINSIQAHMKANKSREKRKKYHKPTLKYGSLL